MPKHVPYWDGPKIAVVGSRDWAYPEVVADFVKRAKRKYPTAHFISGDGGIVDKTAIDTAKSIRMPYTVFPADWDGPKGRGAGFARNTDIVDMCDTVAAFWDGVSSGTLDSITKGIQLHKDVYIWMFHDGQSTWHNIHKVEDIPRKG